MSLETKIWDGFKNGNQEYLGIIFKTYYEELFLYGVKILGGQEATRECIQELFIKLWEKRRSIGKAYSPKGYLFKMFRNLLIDKLRASSKSGTIPFQSDHQNGYQASMEEIMVSKEKNRNQKQQIQQAIEKLNPLQQEIIYLKFYNHLDYKEIADILQINYQTVRNYMSKAIKSLREEITL